MSRYDASLSTALAFRSWAPRSSVQFTLRESTVYRTDVCVVVLLTRAERLSEAVTESARTTRSLPALRMTMSMCPMSMWRGEWCVTGVSVAPGRLRGGLLSGRSMAVQRHPELFAQEERQITYMACVVTT